MITIAADTPSLRKWTHTFEDPDNEEARDFGATFAAIHGLGTRDILVSYRNAQGEVPIPVKSQAQDENVALVRKQNADSGGSHWWKGDTIIIIG